MSERSRRFSREVERVLEGAGWYPGRSIDIGSWQELLVENEFRMNVASTDFLAEFGGLVVDVDGPGVSVAREPFELDPTLCCGEQDRFAGWSRRLGQNISPIGELDRGRFFLGMSESAEIYLVADWIASFGPMPRAIENLVLGVAPKEFRR